MLLSVLSIQREILVILLTEYARLKPAKKPVIYRYMHILLIRMGLFVGSR